MGTRVFIWYNDDELKKLVARYGTDIYKEIVQAIKKESLEESQDLSLDPDTQYKQLRNENLGYKNRIDRIRAEDYEKYHDTFEKPPSKQAELALRKHAESKTRDFTEREYENILNYISLRNHNFKWEASCDICKEGETYDTRYDAINDLRRHLSTEHAKKVMEIR